MSGRTPKSQKIWREKKSAPVPSLPPELLGRMTDVAPYLQPLTRQTSKAYQNLYPLRWHSVSEAYSELMKMMTKKQASEIIYIIESYPGLLLRLANIFRPFADWEKELFPHAATQTLLDQLFIHAYEYSTLDVITTILSKSKWQVNPRIIVDLMKGHAWTKNIGIIKYILEYGPDKYYWELYKVTENLPHSILDTTEVDNYYELEDEPDAWPGEMETLFIVNTMHEMLETDEIDQQTLNRWAEYLQDILTNWEILKRLMVESISAYVPNNEVPEHIVRYVEPFHTLVETTLTTIFTDE